MTEHKKYYNRSLISVGIILVSMPIVHLIAKFLKDNYTGEQLLGAGFLLGLVGLGMVIAGVFVKGDTRQTLLGLIGGIFFWTGWVDFLFMYYADRFHTQAELDPLTGQILSRPEYLLLSATFGLWAMVMVLYIFSTRNGCNFINWLQDRFLGKRKHEIAARAMTRHTSIITFMEICMMLWTCYLLLMFCYDSHFLGREHPLTFAVALGALIGTPFIFKKQLYLRNWGANIRMGVATVIVFWIAVEAFTRTKILSKIWNDPSHYPYHFAVLAIELLALTIYLIRKKRKKYDATCH
ncbi:hypothetical protein NG821_03510 [Prevotella cerevisiae]|uniref:Uncharacterized protein n=1 Tax=Segatella cerevisiae TaxID=2053716 RepID=A0ABT1BUZ7_9BACT|nr:hypothetical protein [Segatella cerevisiae]MCO6024921.1 hypothetical protein [Segatella cerevisiae]